MARLWWAECAGARGSTQAKHLPLQAALLETAICASVGGHPEADVADVRCRMAKAMYLNEEAICLHEGGELLEDLRQGDLGKLRDGHVGKAGKGRGTQLELGTYFIFFGS